MEIAMAKLYFVLLASLFPALVLAQEPPAQIERPEPKVGDKRTYAILDGISKVEQGVEELTLSEITESEIRFSEINNRSAVYDKEWGLVQDGSRKYSPAIQMVSFPLSIGKKWEHSNTHSHQSCGNTTSNLKNEVVGWEDVTVPAGTFRALRIDSSGYWRNNCGSDRSVYKFWYAPKVKWLVKSEAVIYAGGRIYDATIRELKSFHVE